MNKTLLRLTLPLLVAGSAFAGSVFPDFQVTNTVTSVLISKAIKRFPVSSFVVDSHVYAGQYDKFTVGAGFRDILVAFTASRQAVDGALSPLVLRDPLTSALLVTPPSGAEWLIEGLLALRGTLLFTSSATSAGWGALSSPLGEH